MQQTFLVLKQKIKALTTSTNGDLLQKFEEFTTVNSFKMEKLLQQQITSNNVSELFQVNISKVYTLLDKYYIKFPETTSLRYQFDLSKIKCALTDELNQLLQSCESVHFGDLDWNSLCQSSNLRSDSDNICLLQHIIYYFILQQKEANKQLEEFETSELLSICLSFCINTFSNKSE